MLKLGTNSIGKVFLGTTEISKAYLGTDLVFNAGTPPAPPYDSKVEYLGFDGNQFIETGIAANNTIEAEITIMPTNVNVASYGLLSARDGVAYGGPISIHALNIWVKGEQVALNDKNYDSGWKDGYLSYNTKVTLSIKNRKLYAGTTLITSSSSTATFSYNVTYGLLRGKAENDTWDDRQGSSGRLYSTKIWRDGNLVRDMFPVRVGQVGYMYDQISGSLFPNVGSGNFVLGNDIT